jgi:hypothetical protein
MQHEQADYRNPTCRDRPVPVTAAYGQWPEWAGFVRHEDHESSTRRMQTTGQKIAELHLPVTRASAAVRLTTQIPIARRLSPAVSSLKACQTPAR